MTTETLPIEPEVLTPEEAAAYLKMCRKSFDKLVAEMEIPHFRKGRIIRYKKDDLRALFVALDTRGSGHIR